VAAAAAGKSVLVDKPIGVLDGDADG